MLLSNGEKYHYDPSHLKKWKAMPRATGFTSEIAHEESEAVKVVPAHDKFEGARGSKNNKINS